MDVVALVAVCDTAEAEGGQRPSRASFSVSEVAVLADGRRVTLHADRGWTEEVRVGLQPGTAVPDVWPVPPDYWSLATREDIVRTVLNVVLPDDDDDPDDHPYEWLALLLREHGVTVEASDLRTVPYSVEFSPRLEARLNGR